MIKLIDKLARKDDVPGEPRKPIIDADQVSGIKELLVTAVPNFVAQVEDGGSSANFPAVGTAGKIYIDNATNLQYRWNGTGYVKIGGGDLTAINTAISQLQATQSTDEQNINNVTAEVNNLQATVQQGFDSVTNNINNVTNKQNVDEQTVSALQNALNAAVTNYDAKFANLEKRVILTSPNGTHRYYDNFLEASHAMVAGEMMSIYGVHDNGPTGYFANYTDGIIYLAPGCVLKAKKFYIHTENVVIIGPGRIETQDFSLEPICANFYGNGFTLIGAVNPYSYGLQQPVQKHVFENCVIDGGASHVYEALYTYSGVTYSDARFINCRVKTTGPSVFRFNNQHGGNTPDAAALAANKLLLTGCVIEAPAGALAVDDTQGVFTFYKGVNTYINVSKPAKAADASVTTDM
jgi:hypothetical protein